MVSRNPKSAEDGYSPLEVQIKLAEISRDVSYIKSEMDSIRGTSASTFVTRLEFDPIRRIVYGTVTIIGISVLGAILAIVGLQLRSH